MGKFIVELTSQLPYCLDIAAIIPSLINGSLADKWEPGKGSVMENATETIFTDISHTDMFVPVKAASPITF